MIRALILVALFTTTTFAAPDAKQLAKDRVVAAERVHQSAFSALRAGRGVGETVYVWSIRWLDSELAAGTSTKQALADHLTRMTTLDTELVKAAAAGTASPVDAAAAAYFKVEAEYWVARGKR